MVTFLIATVAILALAFGLFGLKIVAIVLTVIFFGIGSLCGIAALWFIIGEGR